MSDFDILPIDVPPRGDFYTASYAFVGEAPSTTEMAKREPFVGPSGNNHDRACGAASIPKYDTVTFNICDTQLPRNNTDILYTSKGYRHPDWETLRLRFYERIREFRGQIIIAYGNTPLQMFADRLNTPLISKQAGSIYDLGDLIDESFRGKFILFTYHPAFTLPFSQPKHLWTIITHLLKAREVVEHGYIPAPEITFHIRPTFDEVLEFLGDIVPGSTTSFDIEAVNKSVTCIAFTRSPTDVMCIPFIEAGRHYFDETDELRIWDEIARILEDPDIRLIAQNGMFDITFLLKVYGIKSDNFYFDTMIAQNLLWADLPKGLDYLTAFYTYHPYYKDEGKQWRDVHAGDYTTFWEYNAKDAAYTHEIALIQMLEIEKINATPTMQHLMELHRPLAEMQWRGMELNTRQMALDANRLRAKLVEFENELNVLCGQEINANSPTQLKKYFYGQLGIKPYKSRSGPNKGAPTTDAMAMLKLARKGYEEARTILNIRRARKLLGTYYEMPVDPDKRIRCSFNIAGTPFGRLASSENIFGSGTNLQNIPKHAPPSSGVSEWTKKFRSYFTAAPGNLLMEIDLSQAEARVVAYMSGDQLMIHSFESGIDVHSFNASKIFEKPIEEVTKMERQLGKKVVHASNYDMGWSTFIDTVAKEMDLWLEAKEAKRMMMNYHNRFPGVKRLHEEARRLLSSTRTLHNLYGRPYKFLGILNGDTFRSAYSSRPQGTVGEGLNRSLVKISLDPRFDDIELRSTVHDSVVTQFPFPNAEWLYEKMLAFVDVMELHLTYQGRSFSIPIDFSIGWDWGNTIEIKTPSLELCKQTLDKLKQEQPNG